MTCLFVCLFSMQYNGKLLFFSYITSIFWVYFSTKCSSFKVYYWDKDKILGALKQNSHCISRKWKHIDFVNRASFPGKKGQVVGKHMLRWLTGFSWDLHEGLNSLLSIAAFWGYSRDIIPSHSLHNVHHGLGLERVWWNHTWEEVIAAIITQLWSCGGIADLRNLKKVNTHMEDKGNEKKKTELKKN